MHVRTRAREVEQPTAKRMREKALAHGVVGLWVRVCDMQENNSAIECCFFSPICMYDMTQPAIAVVR